MLLAAGISNIFGQQYPFLLVPGSPKGVGHLFQDSVGRLWLGGVQGAWFDGSRFFFLRDYGLPAGDVWDFGEDASGGIWIGAETGLYRFANGRLEQVNSGAAIALIAIKSDLVLASIGPPGRGVPVKPSLFRIQLVHTKWVAETVMALDSNTALTLDASGMILFPSLGKGWNELRLADVLRWRPGDSVPVVRHPVAGFPDRGPMKVMRDHSGCVWYGVHPGNWYDCGDGFHLALSKDADTRSKMEEASDGKMVLWGDGLVAVGRPGNFQVATSANGLPPIVCVRPARDGTIWLGSSKGLYRFAMPFRVEYWTVRDGVAEPPWAFARSRNKLYAGLGRRLAVLENGRARWDTVARFQDLGFIVGLLGDKDGSLLASFGGGGAIQVDSNGRVLARTERDRPKATSMRLTRTPDGEVWLGGASLGRLTRKGRVLQWDEHPLQTQPAAQVLAIKYEPNTRKLWACYNGGLVVRDQHGDWQEFTTRDGLLVNACWSVAPLPNGDVWYAYFEMPAIARIRPLAGGHISIRQYDRNDRIPEPNSDTLDVDHRGWLWRGGNLGMYVADQAGAEAGMWLNLESDGFPADGVNSGSVFIDDDGSLWWGSDDALSHYLPPSDLVAPQFSPQIFLSAFSWNGGSPVPVDVGTSLPRSPSAMAHIGSLQFERRNGLRLRYRILPEQTSWRESTSLDLPLGSLSSGTHTLDIQGRVTTGPWSPTLSRSFTVLVPVWLSWPMLLFYVLTGSVVAGGAHLWRQRRLAMNAELIPDLAEWRIRALSPEVDELAGTLLDSRFEVGEFLARGGFATVMKGYDREQKQICAVKVFRSEVGDKASIMRRFEQEVAALGKVRHPNVVSIYAHGRSPSGAPYLVMEFIEGRNLREILDAGPLTRRGTARLLRQLASALDAIHALGIFHRDVKPENVIIHNEGSPGEEAMLIDFSIAIVKDAHETLYGLSRAGSFDYMAPEQAIGYADSSSDIYSLAKLVIEMLSGGRLSNLLPTASLDLPERVRTLLQDLGIGFSREALDMICGALQYHPSARPRVAGSFAAPIISDLDSEVVAPDG
ncbi:MAG TPA: protein kinase [Candidatus Acidoferrales bacterium]|nr:protein kinase [Candidatus Acidoferrales bacterium]